MKKYFNIKIDEEMIKKIKKIGVDKSKSPSLLIEELIAGIQG